MKAAARHTVSVPAPLHEGHVPPERRSRWQPKTLSERPVNQSEVLTETLWSNGPALEALLVRSQQPGSRRVEAPSRTYQQQKHLTRSERSEIAKRYEAGESMGSLAVAFGCHRSAIRRAVDHVGVERRDWRARKSTSRRPANSMSQVRRQRRSLQNLVCPRLR